MAKKHSKKYLYKFAGLLWYEYRGREYVVNPALFTSTLDQHITEQKRIDAEIEREERSKEREYRYEDTADYGLEVFFKSLED